MPERISGEPPLQMHAFEGHRYPWPMKGSVSISNGDLRPCLDQGKAKSSQRDWDSVPSFISWGSARQDLAGSHLKASGFPGVVLVSVGSSTLLFYVLLR